MKKSEIWGRHHITPFSPTVITDLVSTRWQASIPYGNPKNIKLFTGSGYYCARRYFRTPPTAHPPGNAQ